MRWRLEATVGICTYPRIQAGQCDAPGIMSGLEEFPKS